MLNDKTLEIMKTTFRAEVRKLLCKHHIFCIYSEYRKSGFYSVKVVCTWDQNTRDLDEAAFIQAMETRFPQIEKSIPSRFIVEGRNCEEYAGPRFHFSKKPSTCL